MTEASTKTNNPIKRWFAGRLEHRIDRLWLGTALAVVGLVWVLFGVQYIALFLIAYYYIFSAFMRKKIWAQCTEYYVTRYAAEYARYAESDADKHKTATRKAKLKRAVPLVAAILSATAIMRIALWLLENKGFSAGDFSTWLTNSLFCFGFLLTSIIAVMNRDYILPEVAVKIFDAEGKYRKPGNKRIYKNMCTVLFFALWWATFFWYQQGLIGGDAFFRIRGKGEAFAGPVFIHFFVFLFAFLSIHYSFHLSEKSS